VVIEGGDDPAPGSNRVGWIGTPDGLDERLELFGSGLHPVDRHKCLDMIADRFGPGHCREGRAEHTTHEEATQTASQPGTQASEQRHRSSVR